MYTLIFPDASCRVQLCHNQTAPSKQHATRHNCQTCTRSQTRCPHTSWKRRDRGGHSGNAIPSAPRAVRTNRARTAPGSQRPNRRRAATPSAHRYPITHNCHLTFTTLTSTTPPVQKPKHTPEPRERGADPRGSASSAAWARLQSTSTREGRPSPGPCRTPRHTNGALRPLLTTGPTAAPGRKMKKKCPPHGKRCAVAARNTRPRCRAAP